jgi:hypothetical protein
VTTLEDILIDRIWNKIPEKYKTLVAILVVLVIIIILLFKNFNNSQETPRVQYVQQNSYGSGDNVGGDKYEISVRGESRIQISDDQRSRILKYLEGSPYNINGVSYKQGSEVGDRLSNQLIQILKEGEWNILSNRIVCLACSNFDGVGILIADENRIPKKAEILFDALNSLGFTFPVRYIVENDLPENDVWIAFGNF